MEQDQQNEHKNLPDIWGTFAAKEANSCNRLVGAARRRLKVVIKFTPGSEFLEEALLIPPICRRGLPDLQDQNQNGVMAMIGKGDNILTNHGCYCTKPVFY